MVASTSDSLNSTFSGQVQIETELYTVRKIWLQRASCCCSLYADVKFIFRFYFCLQQFCCYCRCLFAVLLFDGWFCSRIRSSVSARDYVRIYSFVQLEHVDAIGTSEVISHSLPRFAFFPLYVFGPRCLCVPFYVSPYLVRSHGAALRILGTHRL